MKPGFLTLLIIVSSLFADKVLSQNISEFPDTNYRKNVIKWNMTTFILFSKKNVNLSYERILSPHRSFSVNAGYFEFFFAGLFDSLFINKTRKKGGFSVSGDYRFYFKERNKHWAPDGLYWGIYSSFHHFQFETSFNVINNPDLQGGVDFSGRFNILSAGAQLGYQFVIKERLTLDLIFLGPSLSVYNRKLIWDASINNENEYFEAIWGIIKNKYPYFSEIVESGEIVNNKVSTNMGYGLRYLIQIGYRF